MATDGIAFLLLFFIFPISWFWNNIKKVITFMIYFIVLRSNYQYLYTYLKHGEIQYFPTAYAEMVNWSGFLIQ